MSVNTVPLGELCEILSGFAWSASKFNQDKRGIPIIRIQNVDAVLSNDFVYWDEPYAERFIIRKGDILLTLSGSFRIESWSGPDALLNQRIIKLTPTSKLTTGWLLHMLRPRLGQIERLGKHALVNNVSLADIRKLDIPLPPLAEQRRIAEVLDKAEALRAKRRAALAQLDSLTQSLFLDLFGDPVANPKKWPKASLNDCTEKIQIGPFGSLLHQEDYVADGIPLVNPKHIQGSAIATNNWESVTQRKYEQLETYHLRQGDIVMGRRGEMGRCAIVSGSEQLLCGTGSLIIRPDNKSTSALFLCAILSTQQLKEAFERLSIGQTLPNLNSGIVGRFMLPLPPISLQREFARRVTAVEKLKTAQRAALAELDSLFASLQHRAFRGEL